MAFELENEPMNYLPVIKVIGVGGGGGNAINRMVSSEVQNVEFIAINTDEHVLQFSKADKKVQIGEKITRGKGAGSLPSIGQQSAEESKAEIAALLKDTDMVPNERLKYFSDQSITLKNAFSIADDVLRQGVQSISDLILFRVLLTLTLPMLLLL